MKDLVETIARSLVDAPEAVSVTETPGSNAEILELRVAPEDLGKVIGKQGRTARAIRVLLHAAAVKKGRRAVLEILE